MSKVPPICDAASAGVATAPTTVGHVMKPTMTIEPGAHLAAATYLIRHSHDAALVVARCDNQVPLGTLGYADIAGAVAGGIDPETVLVKDVAPPSGATVGAEVAVEDAARIMLSQGVERLPVVDAAHLLGIVELDDCRAGADFGSALIPGASP